MEPNKVGRSVNMNLMSFLTGKPRWAFWIVYSALSGIMFGVFYTAMYLMVLQWWIPFIVIIAVGLIWGSLAYRNSTHEVEDRTETKKEA